MLGNDLALQEVKSGPFISLGTVVEMDLQLAGGWVPSVRLVLEHRSGADDEMAVARSGSSSLSRAMCNGAGGIWMSS